jgi:hypothetical protein
VSGFGCTPLRTRPAARDRLLALRKAGLAVEAIARVAGLGVAEYAVLLRWHSFVLVLLVDPDSRVDNSMTLPWLAVIPGFALALWISSPGGRAWLTDPIQGGRIRGSIAHAVAGLVTLRMLAAGPQHLPACSASSSRFGVVRLGRRAPSGARLLACARRRLRHRLRGQPPLAAGRCAGSPRCSTFALVWGRHAPALVRVLVYRLLNLL